MTDEPSTDGESTEDASTDAAGAADAADGEPADAGADADGEAAHDAGGSAGESGEAAAARTSDGTAPAGPIADDDTAERVREYLLKGALVVLGVLGVVATLQFYLSASAAISQFASEQFRPVFRAAFNLVVLLAVGIGIAQAVRRLE